MKKNGWVQTLMLSGLAVGVQRLAEASSGNADATGMMASAGAIAASVIAGHLGNRGASEREVQQVESERQALVARSHHLRRGMASALRRGLESAREKICNTPDDLLKSLFAEWNRLLTSAELDNEVLERLFPAELSESYWSATNTYRINVEEDEVALAGLLREWLTVNVDLYRRWSGEGARNVARQVLPYYQATFAEDLAGDPDGPLFKAFVVKGTHQILALVQREIEESRAQHKQTRDLIRELVLPREMNLGEVRTWRLPLATSYFVGRADFIETLHETLLTTRKVLVWAGAGHGKTQTVLEYVRRYGADYEDVLWVRASDASSLFDSYREIASGLGLLPQTEPTSSEVQRALKSWAVQHPNALLIFDSLDDPQLAVDYWISQEARPFLLATSQKSSVDELEDMTRLELDLWSEHEALGFLRLRTGRVELSDETEKIAAAKMAEETGFLPLALEQASAYIARNKVSFADYLRTYRQVGLRLLNKHKPVAGHYRHSVATTWQASMERLPPGSRELLEAVSHLATHYNCFELINCAPELLGSVLQEALTDEAEVDPLSALLGSLAEYSLVRVDASTCTFSLHRVLHEVVRDAQDENTKSEWLRRWIEVFKRFLPRQAGYREIATYTRTWVAFEALFLRISADDDLAVDAADLTGAYMGAFILRGRSNELEKLAAHALDIRKRALGSDHPQTLGSMSNLAGVYASQGRYWEAEPLYARAAATHEKLLGAEHPGTLRLVNNLAAIYESQGRYGEAEPLYVRTLAASERGQGAEHTQTLMAVNNLAGLYARQGRYGEAEPLYIRDLAARERLVGADHPEALRSVHNLAALYKRQGRYKEAEPLYVRALAGRERVLGAEHPQTLGSVNNLAGLYGSQGRYVEAECLYVRALAANRRVQGVEHPETLATASNFALLYLRQGRYNEAEPLCVRALPDAERVLGAEHPQTLAAVNNLGLLYTCQGRYREAESLHLRALAASERVLGAEHPQTLRSVSNLAELYTAQGRYAEAEPLYMRALTASERVQGAEHPDTLYTVHNFARLYESQGRYGDAEPLYVQALEGRSRVLGAEHPDTIISRTNLATVRRRKP